MVYRINLIRLSNWCSIPPGPYASRRDGSGKASHNPVRLNLLKAWLPIIVMDRPDLINTALVVTVLLLILLILFLRLHYKREFGKSSERLRKKIAEDFHDEMGSQLSVISMYSELTRSQLNPENHLAQQYLHKIISASNNLYGSMKDLIWALDPGRDSLQDLFLRMKDFGDELFSDDTIAFQANGLNQDWSGVFLPMDHKRHILLLFKEAMNNSYKHAQASEVTLSIRQHSGEITITLSDNGSGFDPQIDLNGEGLKNMKSRARKINGHLQMKSSQTGTKISLHCPLPNH